MKVTSTKKRGTRIFKCVKYKHESCGKIIKTKKEAIEQAILKAIETIKQK